MADKQHRILWIKKLNDTKYSLLSFTQNLRDFFNVTAFMSYRFNIVPLDVKTVHLLIPSAWVLNALNCLGILKEKKELCAFFVYNGYPLIYIYMLVVITIDHLISLKCYKKFLVLLSQTLVYNNSLRLYLGESFHLLRSSFLSTKYTSFITNIPPKSLWNVHWDKCLGAPFAVQNKPV